MTAAAQLPAHLSWKSVREVAVLSFANRYASPFAIEVTRSCVVWCERSHARGASPQSGPRCEWRGQLPTAHR